MARDRASRPEARPLRLFVAVDVPPVVKAAVSGAAAPFRERIPGARWTREDGWHATLKFLGATWPRLVDRVHGAIAGVAGVSPSFETAVTAMGVFPSPRRARVVWVGLADGEGRFAEMVRSLDEALASDFTPEKRVYTPHLTLARLNPPRDIGEFVPELPGLPVDSTPWRVTEIVLYRSHLSPRGATYEALERFPLRG